MIVYGTGVGVRSFLWYIDDAQGANCTGDMYAGSYPYENWVN